MGSERRRAISNPPYHHSGRTLATLTDALRKDSCQTRGLSESPTRWVMTRHYWDTESWGPMATINNPPSSSPWARQSIHHESSITAGDQRENFKHADIHDRRSINFWATGSLPITRIYTSRGRKTFMESFFQNSLVLSYCAPIQPRKPRQKIWCPVSTFSTPRLSSEGWRWQITRRTKGTRLPQTNWNRILSRWTLMIREREVLKDCKGLGCAGQTIQP